MATRSFTVRYWSTDPSRLLCGGVRESSSSRWGFRCDAENYLETAKFVNGPHCAGEIVETGLPPEIFSHCPDAEPQAIGGRCPECGEVLTDADALAFPTYPTEET